MEIHDKVSTGIPGFDRVIDRLRLGDNVVWKVDSIEHYIKVVEPFVAQAKRDRRRIVYVRFGVHRPVVEDDPEIRVYSVDPGKGFESFATAVHNIIGEEGRKVFYVFDCLTNLLPYWYSDFMIGNFFKVTCPYLFELDTIAYFAVTRYVHTYSTIARIRETTQLLLDLYHVSDKVYIHPLKVWNRYSPTMFFPHRISGDEAISVTASAEAAELFAHISRRDERRDYWDVMFDAARAELSTPEAEQEETKRKLLGVLMEKESRMFALCCRMFSLKDVFEIVSREVGTGFIGGKSVGMLLARRILEKEGGGRFTPYLEPHDSYYLGSDIYYTYIVENGWWRLRTRQKTREGYFAYAPELKEKMLTGRFPENIREQFLHMLEYFGQSPIIVRSSSLLEDNFGNAFAGKYESVFCVNQGTPEERYAAFEQAIRCVYASTMNEDALRYRMNRGLFDRDEQMAILVQRVSGDTYGELFFPHVAGVGNSSNLYVWDESVDMDAGMLRMVFGLGTRAVDRIVGDYAKIITLDQPLRVPLVNYRDIRKFSQHEADVLSLQENALTARNLDQIADLDLKTDRTLFFTPDYAEASRLRELGLSGRKTPFLPDFKRILQDTEFPKLMREMLALLSRVYVYPVDIEFTANFASPDKFLINLLQCRPLQTRGLGKTVALPDVSDPSKVFLSTTGRFMGGNVHLPVDYVVSVKIQPYADRTEQDKRAVARLIGRINDTLKGKNVMLIGPGRWGTTTPSLGVPVHFTELANMSAICEVSSQEAGFMPELSYGSHFFQDLVEAGIFYAAVFEGEQGVIYNPQLVWNRPNLLEELLSADAAFSDVVHIAKTEGLELFSDIISQKLICI